LSCPSCRPEKRHIGPSHPKWKKTKALQDKLIKELFGEPHEDFFIISVTGSGDSFGSALFRELLFTINGEDFPNVKFNLQTNGVLFTEACWGKMKKIQKNISNVIISLDAAEEETYNVVRRGGNWRTLLRNLKFISKLQTEGHIDRLRLDYVIQSLNYREIPAMILRGQKLGATTYFSRMMDWGTMGVGKFNEADICQSSHPKHKDFLEVLKNPLLQSDNLILGNLAEFAPHVKASRITKEVGMKEAFREDPE